MIRKNIRPLTLFILISMLLFSPIDPWFPVQESSNRMGLVAGEPAALKAPSGDSVSQSYSPETLFMETDWKNENDILQVEDSICTPNEEYETFEPRRDYFCLNQDFNNTSPDGSPILIYSNIDKGVNKEPYYERYGLSPTGTEVGNPYSPEYWDKQEIQSPAKDGHWFPKKSYSVLAFMVDVPSFISTMDIRIDLEPDQDTLARTLAIWFDNTLISQFVVYATGTNKGYHGIVSVWWVSAGEHKIELAISDGSTSKRGWMLTYIWPFISQWPSPANPIYSFWEYFPQNSNSLLEY